MCIGFNNNKGEQMATNVGIKYAGFTDDAIWTEIETGKEYYDHGAKRALSMFGADFYGSHEISDDLAYCLFVEE